MHRAPLCFLFNLYTGGLFASVVIIPVVEICFDSDCDCDSDNDCDRNIFLENTYFYIFIGN